MFTHNHYAIRMFYSDGMKLLPNLSFIFVTVIIIFLNLNSCKVVDDYLLLQVTTLDLDYIDYQLVRSLEMKGDVQDYTHDTENLCLMVDGFMCNRFCTTNTSTTGKLSLMEFRNTGDMPTHADMSVGGGDENNLLARRISKTISTMHQSSSYIARVPKKFRLLSKDMYEPRIISIGPYHSGKKNLKAAQKYKTWYLDSFISRNPSIGLKVYVEIIREIESDVRECYTELINLTSNELVEMMILDGCFILELFYKYSEEKFNMESTDCLFSTTWTVPSLRRDMVLLENQIPFIVLEKLYTLLKPSTQTLSLSELILDFFDPILPTILITQLDDNLQGKHLLDLLRNHLLHQTQALDYRNKPIGGNSTDSAEVHPSHIIDMGDHPMWEFTTCATSLLKGGVKLIRKETAHCLLDITFTSDGEVEMPPFCVGESWSVLFPNLIVLEQCRRDYPDKITSYVILMNKLINSQDDVKVLHDQGIIDGLFMKDEKVVQVINNLSDGVVLDNFFYDGLCSRVNSYNRVRKSRGALLKNEFFRTPWVFISFVAAMVLLLLVFKHTLFPS